MDDMLLELFLTDDHAKAQEVFHRIISSTERQLRKLACSKYCNKAEADDVVQETYKTLWECWENRKEAPANIPRRMCWLFRVGIYKALDTCRRDLRLKSAELMNNNAIQTNDEHLYAISALYNAIEMLNEEEQKIANFILADLTNAKIGDLLGVSEGTIRNRREVIECKMRKLLDAMGVTYLYAITALSLLIGSA